ncbi:MAG: hypothetical protein MUQ32_05325 [Chloroflexi bacterium]|nr:hypothetical protein [Chloroflexota bacterium]
MPPRRNPSSARLNSGLIAALLALLVLLPAAPAVVAADGFTMTARALLEGHVRTGSWFAVAVDIENPGPAVSGELRISGGVDSRTRFGTPVELATGARKQYILYAQPPTFGGTMTVQLVDGTTVVAESKVAVALHDQSQLVVGVVSENPARVVGELDLLPNQNGTQPTIVPLSASDLPDRIQAWSALDRLIWQDTDASGLKPGQLAALRTWVSGGGRLVIIGGTAGADALTAFPDDLLPYRPTGTRDIDPSVLRPLLGTIPPEAGALTAYAGDLIGGRALATSGDRVVAADKRVGAGSVTLLGFDPTTPWIAKGDTIDSPLWRRLLPPRSGGIVSLTDDSTIASAVSNLPSLALPPIGGLLVLLFGYILLVGPVNYIVLRRADRREWAWFTVPALIAVFTVGSFGIGALLRGSEVIVHEVAIVRGAQGTDRATVQSYLGIFSPSRATFQVRVPGDALLAAPMNGDMFGTGTAGALDILQGDPSRIRDLAVGFGSLRVLRAEAGATGPVIDGDLRLEDGRIIGTVTNRSGRTLLDPAVVLGSSAIQLKDLAPGETTEVSLAIINNWINQTSLSDKVVGQPNWDGMTMSEEDQRRIVRRSVIDQISIDPMTGFPFSLAGDSAMLLAWGSDPVVPVEIEGQQVRRQANVLYQVPIPLAVRGKAAFRNDLLRSSVVEVNANFFNKDPWTISFGTGDVRMAFRPIPFEGTFDPTAVLLAMTFGGDTTMPAGVAAALKETVRCDPGTEGCVLPQDGLPELEVLDVRTGAWVQFEHLRQATAYELADPGRWVDPASGELQVRFVNSRQDGTGFQFPVVLEGTIR